MIIGEVTNHAVVVKIPFLMAGGRTIAFEFVLDTGFKGYLSLPSAVVNRLGLPYVQPMKARLANGSPIVLSVHKALIVWDGEERFTDVLALDGEPLLGTMQLQNCDVNIQFVEGSTVTIGPI